jgi:ABC-type sugar transport system ATPase subunit
MIAEREMQFKIGSRSKRSLLAAVRSIEKNHNETVITVELSGDDNYKVRITSDHHIFLSLLAKLRPIANGDILRTSFTPI